MKPIFCALMFLPVVCAAEDPLFREDNNPQKKQTVAVTPVSAKTSENPTFKEKLRNLISAGVSKTDSVKPVEGSENENTERVFPIVFF